MQELDLLILGAGWTSTFLIPILRSHHLSFAATTRDGREVAGSKTIAWSYNPESKDKTQFSHLPFAKYILVTFPLTSADQTATLVQSYSAAKGKQANFIQLGSSGIWQIPQETHWVSRRSPYNKSSPRAIAEDELLKLDGCVLNLAGLWGGQRDPKTWVDRVAKTKEDVKNKKSLHMIHGVDVARAIVAVMNDWDKAKGQRWMLTDGFVYDWWSLMVGWADAKNEETRKKTMIGQPVMSEGTGEPMDQAKWVFELMREEKIWALPRSMEVLGRCYFGREFWDVFGIVPLKARI
ncbi:hypothetical protein LTR10_009413 [Elasticomyces elasticus]|uniref:NAD(P)-binding domain-containing protein n=1 Tax=Elasticomyces elasticus TaxID=574655 RepID=A0AAN7W328_9PEZI|nr:hypothetical protein LTR10_009413 [Elasticomyces elasticus]KAK5695350.1 hypothetical protein LTR97_008856 [Elasticomyces elasticus]